MSALGEAFKDAYSREEDRQLVRAVCRVVEDAIFPFRPGSVQLYTWYNIDYWNHTLKVVVELLPDHVFEFLLEGNELMKDEHAYLNKFYAALFKFYRYRPSLPVEDHIVLGED
jgi:hypothetical protein